MPDFSDPFTYTVPRMLTRAELVQALRMDIADEIEAINVYESHHNATDNEEARRVLAHIIAEEKEHLAEFLEVVKMLDADQLRYLDEAPADVAALIAGAPQAELDIAAAPSGNPTVLPVASVGSLLSGDTDGERAEEG